MSGGAQPDAVPLAGVLARWDALAIRWALDGDERSALLGGLPDGPVDDVRTYDSAAAELRMRLLVRLEPIVAAVLVDEDRIRAWLRRPNLQLAGCTPLDMMASSTQWVRWLIDSLGIAT